MKGCMCECGREVTICNASLSQVARKLRQEGRGTDKVCLNTLLCGSGMCTRRGLCSRTLFINL